MRRRFLVDAAILILLVLGTSCTHEYRFPAPDGKAVVVLKEYGGFSDSAYELELLEGWLRTTRLAPIKNDCRLDFAHAAWSPDSQRVAVHVSHSLCADTWVAYDRRRKEFHPFDTMGSLMRQSLTETYRLKESHLETWGGDPLAWMQGNDSINPASTAFLARGRK